jgi:hypothetical protein
MMEEYYFDKYKWARFDNELMSNISKPLRSLPPTLNELLIG